MVTKQLLVRKLPSLWYDTTQRASLLVFKPKVSQLFFLQAWVSKSRSILKMNKWQVWPVWLRRLGSPGALRGCWSDSWAGHLPELRAWSLVGGVRRQPIDVALTSVFLSSPFSLSLSKIYETILKQQQIDGKWRFRRVHQQSAHARLATYK